MRVVRTFGQEPRHREEFAALNERNRDANMRTVNLNAAYFPVIEFISAVAIVVVLLYGGNQAIDGTIKVGVLVGFLAALNNFFNPITQLSQLYTTYQSGMAALDKIFELLDEQPDDGRARATPSTLPPIRGELRFEHVSFAYPRRGGGPGRLALDDIDLRIAPGETVALVGATGAGKSTLAKLVARFYDPTRGRVLIDGHDLRDVTCASLRSQLGVVPQEAFLFSGTIRSNIAFGRPGRQRRGDRGGGARDRRARLHRRARRRLRHRGRRARQPAVRRPAPARRVRARDDRRPAHPRARRGDLERRPPHRDPHRGGPAPPARRPHGDRHRPPALDDQGRATGSSCSRGGRIVEQGTHDELLAARGVYAGLYRDWSTALAAA